MHYFPKSILTSIFLFGMTYCHADTQSLRDSKVVLASDTMQVIVPKTPLAPYSLTIEPIIHVKHFSEWSDENKTETYELIQRIAQVWKKKGVVDYLIYGKEESNSESSFVWEVVPYPKKGQRFWKQFKVLWNMTFEGSSLSPIDRMTIAQEIRDEIDALPEISISQQKTSFAVSEGEDVFCNPEVIDKQKVFEGNEVYILYNYAPIVLDQQKLHFLIIPKQHRLRFSDLTPTEYAEAMHLVQQLIKHYEEKGYHAIYVYDKTGPEAGQTVPHWHEHVVFAFTKSQEYLSKLTILKKMIMGSSPLPRKELDERVAALRLELSEALAY